MKRISLAALLLGALGAGATAQAQDAAVLAAATAETPALLATLERIVNVESGSKDAAGVAALTGLLEKELAALGMQVRRAAGGSLLASLQGRGQRRILLMAHMDTVYPRGTLARSPFRVEGDKAYGPGIADDKSGVGMVLHTLKLLRAAGMQDYGTLTVLFNNDEEIGSPGSRALIEEQARAADYVLSFEPNMAGMEGFTLGTSGVGRIEATVGGKAAHAGVDPDAGVNALTEAADLVARTLALDDKAAGLRFNWTAIQAGSAGNAIPDSAKLGADVRYTSNEQFDALLAKLEEKAQQKKLAASTVKVDVVRGRPAFNANAGSKALMRQAVAIYAEAGGKLQVVPRIGGGSDAAYAALSGKPVLEGLGLPGGGMHGSAAEFVDVKAAPRRLYLAVRLVGELSRSAD